MIRASANYEGDVRAVVVMLDLSDPMRQVSSALDDSKSLGEQMIEWFNEMLMEVDMRCEGAASELCEVAVILYSGDGVVSLFGEIESPFIKVSEMRKMIYDNSWLQLNLITPLVSPDEYSSLSLNSYLVEFAGDRPMYSMCNYALHMLRQWCEGRRVASTVFVNMTGGAPDDSPLEAFVDLFREVETITSDGGDRVSVVTLLISNELVARSLPMHDEVLSDVSPLCRGLGLTSSLLRDGRRCFVVNESVTDLVSELLLMA